MIIQVYHILIHSCIFEVMSKDTEGYTAYVQQNGETYDIIIDVVGK
jgi:hypothetical protein